MARAHAAGIRRAAPRAGGRRLGLTPSVTPRPRVADSLFIMLIVGPALQLARRLRGLPEYASPPWLFLLAVLAVRHANLRRSWRRAYAASLRAAQD